MLDIVLVHLLLTLNILHTFFSVYIFELEHVNVSLVKLKGIESLEMNISA